MISGHLANSNRTVFVAYLFLHIYTHLSLAFCLAVAYCIFFMDKAGLISKKYLFINRALEQPNGKTIFEELASLLKGERRGCETVYGRVLR